MVFDFGRFEQESIAAALNLCVSRYGRVVPGGYRLVDRYEVMVGCQRFEVLEAWRVFVGVRHVLEYSRRK